MDTNKNDSWRLQFSENPSKERLYQLREIYRKWENVPDLGLALSSYKKEEDRLTLSCLLNNQARYLQSLTETYMAPFGKKPKAILYEVIKLYKELRQDYNIIPMLAKREIIDLNIDDKSITWEFNAKPSGLSDKIDISMFSDELDPISREYSFKNPSRTMYVGLFVPIVFNNNFNRNFNNPNGINFYYDTANF